MLTVIKHLDKRENNMTQLVSSENRIQPYRRNPLYWQYKGKPLLLLGGSVEDNLFQINDLEKHLNTLQACGGNYVRCTMSSRDAGDAWPFARDPRTGLYDLERCEGEYWRRFERFLDLTAERDVILQIELWDRFDFAREPWLSNPYNPRNNVNYSHEDSHLAQAYLKHPCCGENGFFRSVPQREDNRLLLRFQHAQVEKLLSLTLPRGNVLYCIDNETGEAPIWGTYWADYLHARAEAAGTSVYVTEMWGHHDCLDESHEATWKHPETYDFCDISQNNHAEPRTHWEHMQEYRKRILETGRPRPINTVKIYGANTGAYGSTRDAQERFWRNIVGGLAATRFHRPPAGLGLCERAQKHIRAMRDLAARMDIFSCQPSNELLSLRSWNEAYCTANAGLEYFVFFPDGGDVRLDVPDAREKALTVTWYDILSGSWSDVKAAEADQGVLRLCTPREEGYFGALVKVR